MKRLKNLLNEKEPVPDLDDDVFLYGKDVISSQFTIDINK